MMHWRMRYPPLALAGAYRLPTRPYLDARRPISRTRSRRLPWIRHAPPLSVLIVLYRPCRSMVHVCCLPLHHTECATRSCVLSASSAWTSAAGTARHSPCVQNALRIADAMPARMVGLSPSSPSIPARKGACQLASSCLTSTCTAAGTRSAIHTRTRGRGFSTPRVRAPSNDGRTPARGPRCSCCYCTHRRP
ncbi:hypothetical protein B0H11DRAFT_15896 [Mycena galericulata]|nr:hypothetical protein B0H11DRAFT_15896 [Mycena galericulata]